MFESYDVLGYATREAAWERARDRCATNACLRESYAARLAELGRSAKSMDLRRTRENRPGPNAAPPVLSPALLASLGRLAGKRCFGVDRYIDAGDGRASILAHTCGQCMPKDHFIVFHPEHGTYRIVIREPECYVSGIFHGFQDAYSHGLRRIATFSRDGMGIYDEDFYDYDGTAYRHVAKVTQRGIAPNGRHVQITVTRD